MPPKEKLDTPCANPIFVKWLEEWLREAQMKGSKMEFSLRKAARNMRKYPICLKSGQDALLVEGVGKFLAKRLDDTISKHDLDKDKNSSQSLDNNSSSNHDNLPIETSSSKPNQSKPSKTRKPSNRQYIPSHRSGGYAIIKALYLTNQGREPMTKEELIKCAQEHCDSSFITPLQGKYQTAWSSMATLVKKDLVIKKSNPAKFTLTQEGIELAEKILLAEGPGAGDSIGLSHDDDYSLDSINNYQSDQASSTSLTSNPLLLKINPPINASLSNGIERSEEIKVTTNGNIDLNRRPIKAKLPNIDNDVVSNHGLQSTSLSPNENARSMPLLCNKKPELIIKDSQGHVTKKRRLPIGSIETICLDDDDEDKSPGIMRHYDVIEQKKKRVEPYQSLHDHIDIHAEHCDGEKEEEALSHVGSGMTAHGCKLLFLYVDESQELVVAKDGCMVNVIGTTAAFLVKFRRSTRDSHLTILTDTYTDALSQICDEEFAYGYLPDLDSPDYAPGLEDPKATAPAISNNNHQLNPVHQSPPLISSTLRNPPILGSYDVVDLTESPARPSCPVKSLVYSPQGVLLSNHIPPLNESDDDFHFSPAQTPPTLPSSPSVSPVNLNIIQSNTSIFPQSRQSQSLMEYRPLDHLLDQSFGCFLADRVHELEEMRANRVEKKEDINQPLSAVKPYIPPVIGSKLHVTPPVELQKGASNHSNG
eukprot:Ihof_evm2s280 gene=Ihof_evmTU2s280